MISRFSVQKINGGGSIFDFLSFCPKNQRGRGTLDWLLPLLGDQHRGGHQESAAAHAQHTGLRSGTNREGTHAEKRRSAAAQIVLTASAEGHARFSSVRKLPTVVSYRYLSPGRNCNLHVADHRGHVAKDTTHPEGSARAQHGGKASAPKFAGN